MEKIIKMKMEAISVPLYRYICSKCGHEALLLKKISEADEVRCDVCGGKMVRQIGNVGVVFKGNGYYSTDTSKKAAKKTVKSTS